MLIMLLCASAISMLPTASQLGPRPVLAVVTGPSYTLLADFNAWNFSQPSGSNPTLQTAFLFVGAQFTVNVRWVNSNHNFAIYQPGTLPAEVAFAATCTVPKCVVKTPNTVSSGSPLTTLTTSINTPGLYEYYCEIHPSSMHGKIRINRSPDINHDTFVNIIDLSTVGATFGSTPASPNWNPNADLNLDNQINIIDLASVAVVFGRTL